MVESERKFYQTGQEKGTRAHSSPFWPMTASFFDRDP